MGGLVSKASTDPEAQRMAMSKAKSLVASNPLMVFSKTYCPYCVKVKKLLSSLGANPTVIELDKTSDGADVQAALQAWTGQRTVPNVFIGGQHIGGCDSTEAKHREGKLVPLLQDAKAL